MKILTAISLALGLTLPNGAVLALPVKTVFTNNLQGMVIKVWAGHDLSMDFIGSGETVTNAVIGNPAIVLGGLGGTLCPQISAPEQECRNTGAPAIYLRQTKIDPQSSYLLPSADGKTSLILTTTGPEGVKNYVLTIVPARGAPEYAGLDISSPMQTVKPVFPSQNLPVVQAPNQVPEPSITSQWQAQIPAPASQSNNISSPPPQVSSTIQPVNLPNQNPNTSALNVDTLPTATSTPEATPSHNAIAPQEKRANPNAIAYQEETISNHSFAPVKPEQKPATSTTNSASNNSSAEIPKRTVTPFAANNRNDAANVSSTPITQSVTSITQANAIVRGLAVARQKGQINVGTTTWNQVQSVVRLMRRGNTEQESAKAVGVSLQLINQLIVWGQRPTVATTSN